MRWQSSLAFADLMQAANVTVAAATTALTLALTNPVFVSEHRIVEAVQSMRRHFKAEPDYASVEVACMKGALEMHNIALSDSLVESILENHAEQQFVLSLIHI